MTHKQIYQIIARHAKSNCYTLDDCYKSYSEYKDKAFVDCIFTTDLYNGFNGKIISYNSHIFTYGFNYYNGYGDKMFMYITPTKIVRYNITTDTFE